jgi:hypothetical protein
MTSTATLADAPSTNVRAQEDSPKTKEEIKARLWVGETFREGLLLRYPAIARKPDVLDVFLKVQGRLKGLTEMRKKKRDSKSESALSAEEIVDLLNRQKFEARGNPGVALIFATDLGATINIAITEKTPTDTEYYELPLALLQGLPAPRH